MNYLDVKYVNLLSSHLQKFKRKSGNLFNFRCPYCGDSENNRHKARGYVYSAKGKYFYKCHNCGVGTTVKNLLKYVNPVLYDEYIKEAFVESNTKIITSEEYIEKAKKYLYGDSPFKTLKKVSQLAWNHPCKEYVLDRKIPNPWHAKLYYAPKFMEWVNTLIPNKFDEKALKHESDRLIIPFISRQQKVFGFQGRALDPKDELRYISIILDEECPKVFGLDFVDVNRRHYLVEGPFDSMFLPNAAACAGGELLQVVPHFNRDKVVLVFDNEPRHKHTLKKIRAAVNQDYQVVIWPEEIREKDINEMVQHGMTPEYIKTVIDKNTFSGLEAQLKFANWNKIGATAG